jgi:hypothetical protein
MLSSPTINISYSDGNIVNQYCVGHYTLSEALWSSQENDFDIAFGLAG